jgi:hypothetical protein
MPQTEVPREHWKSFCNEFTRQHQAWIINLSVVGVRLSAAMKAEEAEQQMRRLIQSNVFQGIMAEPRGGDYTMSIIAGSPPMQVTHFICDPIRLLFQQTEEGAHEGLVIENASGQTTLLRFRAAALPEIVDGISEAELLSSSRSNP